MKHANLSLPSPIRLLVESRYPVDKRISYNPPSTSLFNSCLCVWGHRNVSLFGPDHQSSLHHHRHPSLLPPWTPGYWHNNRKGEMSTKISVAQWLICRWLSPGKGTNENIIWLGIFLVRNRKERNWINYHYYAIPLPPSLLPAEKRRLSAIKTGQKWPSEQ